MRFYDRDNTYRPYLVGELALRQFPSVFGAKWRAPVPPVTVTRDSREFRLVSFCRGQPFPRSSTPAANTYITPWTTAVFEVLENGSRSTAWTIRAMEGQGVTGNHLFMSRFECQLIDSRLIAAFPEVLWQEEPDWKFLVEFSRLRDFAQDDLWTFRSLPAIRALGPYTTNFEVTVRGVTLRSLDIRATRQLQEYVRGGYRRTSDLTLMFTSTVHQVRVDLARIVDDRGREIRFGDGKEVWPGKKYTAGIEVPRDAVSLDLTFAVHRSEFVEFLVRPVMSSSNASFPALSKPATNSGP
jgi:hypothetical protein